MLSRSCAFETDRLLVAEWHSASWPAHWRDDLPRIVAGMLTERATRTLPPAWRGAYTEKRAREWIAERDEEATMLLVVEKAGVSPAGLVVLSDVPSEDGTEIRLGYVIAEAKWGLGLATELVEGLVRWCRAQPSIRSLAGGVASDNPASKRVLEKNGFRPGAPEGDGSEEILRLDLRT